MSIRDLVYGYNTQHPEGFTAEEVRDLLHAIPEVGEAEYKNKFGINTALVIDGETVYFHCDVYKTIICCLDNRELTTAECD